jgi:predicted nucleic-acid-binding protein
MIGLDTNVLVRYLMQDDPHQSAQATALMETLSVTNRGFVSLVSVAKRAGCSHTVTFDRKAAAKLPNMERLD